MILFLLAAGAAFALQRPELAEHGGVVEVDLNGDGHLDLVVSNPRGFGVFLFNPVERKNVDWGVGWTEVLREGKPGDPGELPLIRRGDGADNRAWVQDGALWIEAPGGRHRLSFEELLKVPGPPPLTPAESMERMELAAGWKITLAAAEPLVIDPVFFDWDEKGRLWVVEMGDYPFAPGEKTRDGAVGQERVSDLQGGRVRILEDRDGDGVFDHSVIFLDGLRHPTGLFHWRGGVFISAIPDILYAADTNGDGEADLVEPWLSGFADGNPQHLVNGFCMGLDGWLHGANGDSGGMVRAVKTGGEIALGTHDFRFHPDTGEFQLEAGRTQFGKWRDDFGNWFGNNNSTIAWHYHLPLRWLERHPDRAPPALRAVTQEDKTVYPLSSNQRRFNWANATGALTSGCSPFPWRAAERETWLLVCEPQNNLLHRQVLDYSAFPIRSARHPDDQGRELLRGDDPWFRPVLAREGPDGALYVADMYRLVLEHPEWIPAQTARGLDLRAGEDKGRIYRLQPPDWSEKWAKGGLASRVRWQRDLAQQLLLEAGENADAAEIARAREIALGHADDAVRLQARFTLAAIQPEDGGARGELVAEIRSQHPRARAAALVAAGELEPHPEELASWFPANKIGKQDKMDAPVVRGSVDPERQKVTDRYVAQIAGLAGDAARGEEVLRRACLACHKVGAMGVELGPDLLTVAAKPDAQLIEAIFDPDRAVEDRYALTMVKREGGPPVAGLVTLETPGQLTLTLPGGATVSVPKNAITKIETLPKSLMPEGLENLLTPQDVADLLARLRGK